LTQRPTTINPNTWQQVLLNKAGYFCGEDDMRWWQLGSPTQDALKTFQVGDQTVGCM
jgi:hypothetical protein